MPNDIDKINSVVNKLLDEFRNKYGYTVFNVRTESLDAGDVISLTGECLTLKQLTILKRRLSPLFDSGNITYDIKVLSELRPDEPGLWGVAKKALVNITGDFAGKKLSTEITPDDGGFKIILRNNGKSLLLLADSTLGWTDDSAIKITGDDLSKNWRGIKRLKKGEAVQVDSIDKLFTEAAPYIGRVKYLLGGRSVYGIDCSALIQLVFKAAFGLITPRHTLDIMKCGERVAKGGIINGDLIFAKKIGTNILHAGIVCVKGEIRVIHSCLKKKIVLSETITDFYENYSFASARRVVKEKV